MKTGTVLFAALLICAALVFTSGSAQAFTYSNSIATIENLSISSDFGVNLYFGPDPNFGWVASQSNASVLTSLGSNSDSSGYLFNQLPSDAYADVAHAAGSGWTTGNQVYEEVWAELDGVSYASAYADALMQGFFTVSGSGNVTFSGDYTLFQDLNGELFEYAFGSSYAELSIENQNTSASLFATDLSENWAAHGDFYTNTETDTWSLTLYFNDGDTGFIQALVSNSGEVEPFSPAPVPEPATILLLGSGLIGLGAFGRRKKIKG